jgi:hypothetical protein
MRANAPRVIAQKARPRTLCSSGFVRFPSTATFPAPSPGSRRLQRTKSRACIPRAWKYRKLYKNQILRKSFGGAEGNRTPDLCSAIAALSHLSYGPECAAFRVRLLSLSRKGPENCRNAKGPWFHVGSSLSFSRQTPRRRTGKMIAACLEVPRQAGSDTCRVRGVGATWRNDT